jgi:hypothetical protein
MKTFFLVHDQARAGCAEYSMSAPTGYMVRFSEPKRKNIQNEKFHAMIGEIAQVVPHAGRLWNSEDMKRILIEDFSETMRNAGTPLHHDIRITPSLDGRRIVSLGIQSSEFLVKEASQFIEYLFALGAEHEIEFKELVRME